VTSSGGDHSSEFVTPLYPMTEPDAKMGLRENVRLH
jgi:hypothetical protein